MMAEVYILKFHQVMKLLAISIFLSICVQISSQSTDLEALKKQHAKYKTDIENAKSLLSQKVQTKNSTLNQLEIISAKIQTQQKLVNSYKVEIGLLNRKLDENKALLDQLNSDIKQLKNNYSRLIIQAQKHSYNHYSEFMLIFSSQSLSEAYRRFQLLKQYSSYRKKQGEILNSTIMRYDSIVDTQKLHLSEKQKAFSQLNVELLNLESAVKNKKKYIQKLTTDEKWLKKNIQENIAKSKKLEKEIENLIIKESKSSVNTVSNFSQYKGKLKWPVEDGIVTNTFGEHNHAILKGVKVKNNGIDITTSKDNDVKAVYKGTVSRVIAIPGYNKAVIIRHGKYLTVYANLRDVLVKNGQEINTDQIIGKIFSTRDDHTAVLHFEIWEGSNKTNPVNWLSPN